MKRNQIAIPLFNVGKIEFHVDAKACTESVQKLRGYAGGDCYDSAGICWHHLSDKHGMVYVMGVFDGKHGTVAHESFHTALRILSYVNVPVVMDESNETMAYLIDAIVTAFYKVYPDMK